MLELPDGIAVTTSEALEIQKALFECHAMVDLFYRLF